jgi:hypothetical protein
MNGLEVRLKGSLCYQELFECSTVYRGNLLPASNVDA